MSRMLTPAEFLVCHAAKVAAGEGASPIALMVLTVTPRADGSVKVETFGWGQSDLDQGGVLRAAAAGLEGRSEPVPVGATRQ